VADQHYEYFKNVLKYPPVQGAEVEDEERPVTRGTIKILGGGLDEYADAQAWARDQGTPVVCEDENLPRHGLARGLAQLANESINDYRRTINEAFQFWSISGRAEGYASSVQRATNKPFKMLAFTAETWHMGDGFGSRPWGSSTARFIVWIHFLAPMSTEALAEVEKSVETTGKAFRDEVVLTAVDDPLGEVLQFGRAGWGYLNFGYYYFPLSGTSYYLLHSHAIGSDLTASSEAAEYPATNSQALSVEDTWRSTGLTEWLKADLSEAREVKGVALVSHNLTEAATVNIEANNSDSWGAPPFSMNLPVAGTSLVATFDQTYRWWRLTIDDPTNADGYVEAAIWHLGQVGTI